MSARRKEAGIAFCVQRGSEIITAASGIMHFAIF